MAAWTEYGRTSGSAITSVLAHLQNFTRVPGGPDTEELQAQAMETTKRVLGEEHPDTLTNMNNLALTYRNQGRWKEAEELQAQAMDTTKRVLGEEHPHTLTSMNNLALIYWNQGRWKEAEELQAQAMETSKRVLGEEHPDTLT
ncbi:MAG: hypothetical protein Q9194_002319, partial [Teloschistes cf. exilis]